MTENLIERLAEGATGNAADPAPAAAARTGDELLAAYEAGLAGAREAVDADPVLRRLLAADCDPVLFRAWMLRFSAHGVHMTKPVEGWISTAGDNCADLGLTDLGKALRAHARAESGHEKMMIDDARNLAERGDAGAAGADVETLLAAGPLASTIDYVELHQRTIGGDRPYGQVAIEYEIERLSTVIGPRILDSAEVFIGTDGTGYSFIADHVELDQGHTTFNRRQLAGLLERRPADLDYLIETGGRALASYAGFFAECLALAERDVAGAADLAGTPR